MALITEANCLAIGGKPQAVAGKLICIVKDKVGQVERSGTQENNS